MVRATMGLLLGAAALGPAHAGTLPRVETTTLSGVKRFVKVAAPEVPFYPRGADYIRLNGSQGSEKVVLPVYHSTFSPELYNKTEARAALRKMRGYGYDFTRVFIDGGSYQRGDGINGPPAAASPPLSPAYVANLVEFLGMAAAEGVYTMITLEQLPANKYFNDIIRGAPRDWVRGPNSEALTTEYTRAWVVYVRELLSAVSAGLKGDTTGIFAVSFANEWSVTADALPFSASDIKITTADGVTYDMGDAASRQQCVDANVVHWVNTVAAAARAVTPGVMVALGMFTFQAVGKRGPDGIQQARDPRHPPRPGSLSKYSTLDFLDVHVYPNDPPFSLADGLATEEWAEVDFARLPILMAEFGAFKNFYTLPAAATALRSLIADSCAFTFSGWAMWTWDTHEQSGRLWHMLDGGEALAKALAPVNVPDPCVAP